MSKVYISCSNQNANVYAGVSPPTNESIQCNKIGDSVIKYLKLSGIECKKNKIGDSMSNAVKESNDFKATFHVCIHTNAGGGKGTEVYVFNDASKNLIKPIYDELVLANYYKVGRGIKLNQTFYEIMNTTATVAYCECEFHDTAILAKHIVDNVDNYGKAIVKGICKILKVTFKDSSTTTNTQTNDNLFKVTDKLGKQVGAYSNRDNSIKKVLTDTGYKIKLNGKDIV